MKHAMEVIKTETPAASGKDVVIEAIAGLGGDDYSVQEPAWRRFLRHVGPGFMVSLAYLDPGNYTDCETGGDKVQEDNGATLKNMIVGAIPTGGAHDHGNGGMQEMEREQGESQGEPDEAIRWPRPNEEQQVQVYTQRDRVRKEQAQGEEINSQGHVIEAQERQVLDNVQEVVVAPDAVPESTNQQQISSPASSIPIPQDWQEAKQHPVWRTAMLEEMEALDKNNTWAMMRRRCHALRRCCQDHLRSRIWETFTTFWVLKWPTVLKLLWVILIGLIFALIIQSLSANLGVVTGRHLAELCKSEYPVWVKFCLWLLAEVAVIAADIPEVIGTAFAFNLLFNIPVWIGVLIAGTSTLLLLGLQRYGVRKLKLLVALLVFVMAACFFVEMSIVKPPAKEVLKGLFIPKLNGSSATADAIALLGALVMPHNLFLHSALVLSRSTPASVRGMNDACRLFLFESGIALFVALLVNIAIISVSGTVCNAGNLSPEDAAKCGDLTLDSSSFLLKNVLGRSSAIVYGVALLASGQSSSITGTYAGQYIMQGFLDIKMKKWMRNLMTRSIAIIPSLVVSIIGGSSGAGRLIIIASMILSFELPFALIPLLKFSSSSNKMGQCNNSIYIVGFSWTLGFIIIGINVYFLSSKLVGWILHNSLPIYANILVGITLFPLMLLYIATVIYLTFRKDTAKFVSRRELQDIDDDTEQAKVANEGSSEDNNSRQSN